MRSHALAIGWEFRRRHRWGRIAVAGYLFVVATIRFLILEPGEPVLVDSVRFAALVSVPLTTTFVYLLAVFSFGFAGDLAARHSMYPARMFTLPVTNAALVGWPMLYGTAAVAVLWLAARVFAVWPSGIENPLILPGPPAAAPFAVAQAPTWVPPGLAGTRLAGAVALLGAAGTDAPAFVFEILFLALITPPFMAACTAWTVSQPNPQVHDSYGLPPFIATRPLTSAEFIAAKLKIAMWSTLTAWLLVLVAMPLALEWSGTWSMVTERARRMNDAIGTPRAATVVLLILAGFIVATWKQLVQSLHIGLTGREWIVKGSVLLTLTFLILLGPIVEWIIDSPSVQRALWNALPLILAGLVGLKMSAAAWIATRLDRNRLLGDRALVAGAACWLVAVLALYGVLVWFFSTPFVAHYVLALIAILAVPLARISAAPLALPGNRDPLPPPASLLI